VKNKIISAAEAAAMIHDGDTVMFGGFLGNACAENIVEEMLKNGTKDLIVIANDTAFPEIGHGRLVVEKRVKKLMASHVGTNRVTGNQMATGEMDVTLVPQGTLMEQIRAGGFGLGGVLTPTGIGTDVEKGKEKLTIDGKEYLLEKPLRAKVAILQGAVVDTMGNIWYRGSSRNFCQNMAFAADTVIVEAEKIVQPGEIRPEDVHTACILVDYIVQGRAR
jgi:acetate CoA/acetoacetate CoA-transferase alpha subunit